MRLAALIFLALPGFALADSLTLRSTVTDVTVYPMAAKITRKAHFAVPAGRHNLILSDLPASIDLQFIRVKIDGVQMGAMTMRQDFVPPNDGTRPPDVEAAEDAIEAVEQQINAVKDAAAQAKLAVDAAKTQIHFLRQLGGSDDIATAGIDTVRGLSRMISQEALAAQSDALAGKIKARRIELNLKDLQQDLERARQALRALVPAGKERSYLSVAIAADLPTDGAMIITYYDDNAMWQPVYDMHLTRGASPFVRIERGALVRQDTGETWNDINLVLSTAMPTSQAEPSTLRPRRRAIYTPEPVKELPPGNYGSLAEPAIAPAVIVEYAMNTTADFDGYVVTYEYSQPVTVATNADAVRLKLGTLTLDAEIKAQAVPRRDDTAFLVAHVTNDSGEVIFGSEAVSIFVDETFVGLTDSMETIPTGATSDLPFGPINGLRLERVVVRQKEGDRGVLSTSKQQTKSVQITIENLTNESWPVRLLDQVPYSKQDDLKITWSATPEPSEVDVDNKRGILGWDITLAPHETRVIDLNQTLTWPDGKFLR